MVDDVGALGKHLALVGFMGAGKTTIGREVARVTHRPFVDTDAEVERLHGPIPALFAERGEAEFRRIERETILRSFALAYEPSVFALGGGALGSDQTRVLLRERAFTCWVDVPVETALERVAGSDRPLARNERTFRELFDERRPLYERFSDERVVDADGVLLAGLAVSVRRGASDALTFARGDFGPIGHLALIIDESLLPNLTRPNWWRRRGTIHTVPSGEAAKTLEVVERLWGELTIDRAGGVVAWGGGTTTDVAGFVAASYQRGVDWRAIPTSLTGQVDAAIGGKTAINLASGKNLVGAFHFPSRVLIDPDLLATLPPEERRAGMAEVVKTGLLAGRDVWELPEEEMIRACAAYKAGVVLSDPYETQELRTVLNLGHTFAHALEAASGYAVPHGEAVALGLLAALRLSGRPTDVVEDLLTPEPVRVDRDAAWEALRRDKKALDGRPRLVLLRAPGEPECDVELPDADVRAALDSLIAS